MPTITFKVSEAEARRIRRDARQRKAPVSAYIRSRLLPPEEEPPKLIMKRHPVSGSYYNAAPGQRNPSLEEIKAILADFP